MGKNPARSYEGRISALKKRRDFLQARINSDGRDLSYDKQECSAINWALSVIQENPINAMDIIEREYAEKRESEGANASPINRGEDNQEKGKGE